MEGVAYQCITEAAFGYLKANELGAISRVDVWPDWAVLNQSESSSAPSERQ